MEAKFRPAAHSILKTPPREKNKKWMEEAAGRGCRSEAEALERGALEVGSSGVV